MSWATIGGIAGSFFGPLATGVGYAAGSLLDQHRAEDAAQQGQQWSAEAQASNFAFQREQTQQQMAFQERMSNTAWQRAVKDMTKAGLNPMLAYSQGGATAPTGASGGGSSFTGQGPRYHPVNPAVITTAAQIENLRAQTEKTNAEADNIREQTPTHAVTRSQLRQQINESVERIQDIQQQVRTGAASAERQKQQSENLRETIPQIRQTVQHLRALTTQATSSAILMGEQGAEIRQRVRENLPEIERILKELQRKQLELDQPRRAQESTLHTDPILGALASLLKLINPLSGLLGGR